MFSKTFCHTSGSTQNTVGTVPRSSQNRLLISSSFFVQFGYWPESLQGHLFFCQVATIHFGYCPEGFQHYLVISSRMHVLDIAGLVLETTSPFCSERTVYMYMAHKTFKTILSFWKFVVSIFNSIFLLIL
jgi:hypothetical protein